MIIKLKSGFTLIELTVVIGVFGILAVVAANFLLSTVATTNRTNIESDIRQNVTLIMTDITSEVRKAACVNFKTVGSNKVLTISSDSDDKLVDCDVDTSVEFIVDSAGLVYKNGNKISSQNIAFCTTPNACDGNTDCDPGLSVSPVGTTDQAVDITLSARQKKASKRQDSCAGITLSETVTPRNAGN